MIVYSGLKRDFCSSVYDGSIVEKVEELLKEKAHRTASISEHSAFNNSLREMYVVLDNDVIPSDAGIAIEYNIPQTNKRVDFIITGYDSNNRPNAVVIELKQWEKVEKVEGPDALVETYTGGGIRKVVHPSYQVWSYASMIKDYNETVQDKEIELYPCAYLHNYTSKNNGDPIRDDIYSYYLKEAPVFDKKEREKLVSFIAKTITRGGKEIIYELDGGKIRPSKRLQDSLERMLQGNQEFNMLDEQKVVYETILEKAMSNDGKKKTIIVEGGPGTGKSVVAINLLCELTKRGQFVQYASTNAAPRNVYAEKLSKIRTKTQISNLFKGTGSYYMLPSNVLDTCIVDEAHRLREKSGIFKNCGENQIKEIISASKCSVFFIDNHQRVTFSDIGSVEEIERWAKEEAAECIKMELSSQFRCNGSDGYLAWVDNTLGIRETANYTLSDIDYDIRIIDSPEEVRELIREKNKINNRSRMLAGYCWNWNKETRNDPSVFDINIGSFSMSWNMENDIFALSEKSIDEVGCIHTSQGLEFDYVGLIIGPDMYYSGGKVLTDRRKRAKTDQSLSGIGKIEKVNKREADRIADEIIKNTYRTLLTRGMKGCYVYCVDSELQSYLKSKLS